MAENSMYLIYILTANCCLVIKLYTGVKRDSQQLRNRKLHTL